MFLQSTPVGAGFSRRGRTDFGVVKTHPKAARAG
jgi:hypothetical protein